MNRTQFSTSEEEEIAALFKGTISSTSGRDEVDENFGQSMTSQISEMKGEINQIKDQLSKVLEILQKSNVEKNPHSRKKTDLDKFAGLWASISEEELETLQDAINQPMAFNDLDSRAKNWSK